MTHLIRNNKHKKRITNISIVSNYDSKVHFEFEGTRKK